MERLRAGDPEQIGPWQIVNRLGSGGMGLVYLGTNGTRAAAIKVVRNHLLEDPTSRTRLAREVESLKKAKSSFIAEIVGSDVAGSPAWIATKFVDGPSLKTLIDNEGPMDEAHWIFLAQGLAEALSAVHKAGIIHRDVKPSNILMSADGPKLIDFGISFSNEATSLTRTGLVAGTPAWLAPEQFENREMTDAIDNFALGSVLFFAATGAAPWGSDDSSVAQVMRRILSDDPDLKKLSQIQKSIISKLLEKDPKKRLTASSTIDLLGIKEAKKLKVETPKIERIEEVTPKPNKKKFLIRAALGSAFVAVVAFTFLSQGTSKSTDKVVTNSTKTTAAEIKWSGKFLGDSTSQTGKGNAYKLYVCDQGISAGSLQISGGSPSATSKPTVNVINSDPTCGSGFDTIFVKGIVPDSGSATYLLTGKTSTGQAVSYEYSVSKV